MSAKIKNGKSVADQLNDGASQAGLALMTVAVTLGMIELPDHPNKIIVPNQPALAFAGEQQNNNPLRREREESAPHYVSYSANQRTPGRSGWI